MKYLEAYPLADAINIIEVNYYIQRMRQLTPSGEIYSNDLKEFIYDCMGHGVQFHRCGFAMHKNSKNKSECYLCKAFKEEMTH